MGLLVSRLVGKGALRWNGSYGESVNKKGMINAVL